MQGFSRKVHPLFTKSMFFMVREGRTPDPHLLRYKDQSHQISSRLARCKVWEWVGSGRVRHRVSPNSLYTTTTIDTTATISRKFFRERCGLANPPASSPWRVALDCAPGYPALFAGSTTTMLCELKPNIAFLRVVVHVFSSVIFHLCVTFHSSIAIFH